PAGTVQCSSIRARPPGAVCQAPESHASSEIFEEVPDVRVSLEALAFQTIISVTATINVVRVQKRMLDFITYPSSLQKSTEGLTANNLSGSQAGVLEKCDMRFLRVKDSVKALGFSKSRAGVCRENSRKSRMRWAWS